MRIPLYDFRMSDAILAVDQNCVMVRPLRIEFPDAVYHVTSRGDRREPIYRDDRDRRTHLEIIADGMRRANGRAFAYCLMGNHFHLVLQTRQANLSQLMRHINGAYAQAFNRRHCVAGHLLQGRFTAILVDRDAYLLALVRYVERNPVAAGLVADTGHWRWSSYRAHVGMEAPAPWLETEEVLALVLGRAIRSDNERATATRRYVAFVSRDVSAPTDSTSIWSTALRQQIYLGDESFVARMQRMAALSVSDKAEIPRPQRTRPFDLARFLRESGDRNDTIRRACLEHGATMSAVARALELSVSRVSRIVAAGGQAKGKT